MSRPIRLVNSSNEKGSAGTMWLSLLALAGLLAMPVMALLRRAADWRWVAAYALAVGALTYWRYASDKRRAQAGEWRVPEAQLHLLELAGGWPGAWLAQRRLRHKCSKGSYLAVFWLIVLGYQFTAYDSLQDWQYSRAGLKWIQRTAFHT